MAGSYGHIIAEDGKLLEPNDANDMLDTFGDVYEALEEMYGMIWYLSSGNPKPLHATPAELVELARQNYKVGLSQSPGVLS